MASTPKFWPRPRRQTFGLGLASISLSYYVMGHISGKNRVKFGNFVNFSSNNRKSYVVNYFWYFSISFFGLGLGLGVLASFNITNGQTTIVLKNHSENVTDVHCPSSGAPATESEI